MPATKPAHDETLPIHAVGKPPMIAQFLGPLQIEFGLHQIEDNPNLTFITFLGVSLLAVLGLRFSYYAQRNLHRSDIESQAQIWRTLRYGTVDSRNYDIPRVHCEKRAVARCDAPARGVTAAHPGRHGLR